MEKHRVNVKILSQPSTSQSIAKGLTENSNYSHFDILHQRSISKVIIKVIVTIITLIKKVTIEVGFLKVYK